MKNLKRALSLALASVMLVGTMVVSASAGYEDFTDKDEIQNKDAVSTLVELGVIAGKEDGSYYAPNDIITRAEMAKLICVVLNGGPDLSLGTKDKPSYTDIKGTWAESYIEYCSTLNIIAGRGNGKFDPTATVTGAEAAKMLLVALGYDASVEGLVGASWELSTTVLANQVKLFKGLEGMSVSAGLTRDSAAQMVYNALDAKEVYYSNPVTVNGVTIGNSQRFTHEYTLMENRFGVVKLTGVVTANEFASLNGTNALDEGKTTITLDDETLGVKSGTFKVSTGEDVLGRDVTLFAKPGNTTSAEKATIVGKAVVGDTNKVVTTTDDMTNKDMKNLLDDNKLSLTDKTLYSANYDKATTGRKLADSNVAGVKLTLIDNNDDGNVDYVIQFAKTFGKVVNYSDAKKGGISVSAINRNGTLPGTLLSMTDSNAKEKVVGFEDVAKNDYVFFYTVGGVKHVEKANSVDATITSIRGEKVVADGTTYIQSGLVTFVDENGKLALEAAVKDSLGKTVKFYLDEGNNVVYVTNVDSTVNFLYVDVANTIDKITELADMKVVLSDGTSAIVKGYVLGDGDKKESAENGIYSYSVNSDGTYELKAVSGDYKTTATESTITKGQSKIGDGVYANSETVFVVYDGTSYVTYTGIANVPSMKNVEAKAVYKDSTASVVFVTKSDLEGNSKSIYVLNEKPIIEKDGDKTVYKYDVVFEGVYQQLTYKNANAFATTGLYKDAKVNGDTITATGTLTSTNVGKAVKNSNGLIAVEGGTVYSYDSKTVFVTLDNSGSTADEMVMGADIASVIIDEVNAENTSTIVIIPGSNERASMADYVYILK